MKPNRGDLRVGRLNRLIAHLRSCPPDAFDQTEWFDTQLRVAHASTMRARHHEDHIPIDEFAAGREFPEGYCGTACCLAGHTLTLISVEDRKRYLDRYREYKEDAENAASWSAYSSRKWLGLTLRQEHALFLPKHITRTDVADVNSHLEDTGFNKQVGPAISVLERLRDTGRVTWGIEVNKWLKDHPW